MSAKGYHDTMKQLLMELWSKGDEARINENLASICRELDRFLPHIKQSAAQGAPLTAAERERIQQLNEAYNANIERYKALKGFK